MNDPFVYVACKLRNGVMIGGHQVVGNFQEPDKYYPPDYLTGGYYITPIPKSAWDTWFGPNARSSIVANHLISGHATQADAKKWCKEHGWVSQGLMRGILRPT